MHDVVLGVRGKARIWVEELPDCDYVAEETLTRQLLPHGLHEPRCTRIAVELLRHGGNNPYGLLGAGFLRKPGGPLTVQVASSSAELQLYDGALAGKLDRVRIGLMPEYAGAVLEGAVATCSESGLCAGVLSFRCAAYGEIGSSQYMFGRLARIVTNIIARESESTAVKRFTEMVDAY